MKNYNVFDKTIKMPRGSEYINKYRNASDQLTVEQLIKDEKERREILSTLTPEQAELVMELQEYTRLIFMHEVLGSIKQTMKPSKLSEKVIENACKAINNITNMLEDYVKLTQPL